MTEQEQGYLSTTGALTQPPAGTGDPPVYTAFFNVAKGDAVGRSSLFSVKVLPVVADKTNPVDELDQYIKNINNNPNTANNDPIVLPEKLGSASVAYEPVPEPTDNSKYVIFFSCVFVAALVFVMLDRSVEDNIKKKRERIKGDFPEFVSKFALLLGCGLTTYDAFMKIVSDNKGTLDFNDHPLYLELETTLREVDLGKAEVFAYEDFGLRCRISETMKFSALVTQYLRRGTADLLMQLKEQVADVWQLHKANIRRKGEEASTMMLLPMILSLVSVLLVVIYPAFSSIKF
jgi:hypothetical protein